MFKRVGMLFLVFVLGTVGAFAQQETGQISGKVVDPNGAAVAKAAVTVKSVGTSAQRDTTTDDSGNYILTNLQPGLYDVTVKSSGFADRTQQAQVTVGGKLSLDITLSLAKAALRSTPSVRSCRPSLTTNKYASCRP